MQQQETQTSEHESPQKDTVVLSNQDPSYKNPFKFNSGDNLDIQKVTTGLTELRQSSTIINIPLFKSTEEQKRDQLFENCSNSVHDSDDEQDGEDSDWGNNDARQRKSDLRLFAKKRACVSETQGLPLLNSKKVKKNKPKFE